MKILKISLLFGMAGVLLFSSCKYKAEINAVKSLSKISEGVFFLEYEGDYGFDKYLSKGGSRTPEELTSFISGELKKGNWTSPDKKTLRQLKITSSDFGCSSISVKNSASGTGRLYGRNYDWKDCQVLIIHSKPDAGYESISTCCLSHIGIPDDWEPKGKFFDDIVSLAALYVPMDGMNEKGLYIADLMAGDDEKTEQERGNVSIITTDAIRLVLDKAANVDEALALIEQYDMHSVIGWAHHFAIADAQGKAVAVEWVNNRMYVTETPRLTNHYVTESPKKDDGINPETENSRIRFTELEKRMTASDSQMTAEQVRDTLKSVRAGQYDGKALTVWSAVFEPENKRVNYYFRENYDKAYVFELQ